MTAWLIQMVGYTGQAFDLGLDDASIKPKREPSGFYVTDGEHAG